MPHEPDDVWTDRLRRTLERYDEALLRRVAAQLVKPRNHWPAEELIDRCSAAVTNAPVIDRRLKDLDVGARQLLAAVGHSRQPRWPLGNLVEVAVALGQPDGLRPVLALLEAGLLYPGLPAGSTARLKGFDQWLTQAAGTVPSVFAHPAVAARARGEDLGLPSLAAEGTAGPVLEADGLEWPLRLSALWQAVAAAPLRRTMQGEFFKRDLERLGQDALLSAPPAESLADLPHPALLAVALAECEGILLDQDGEVKAGNLPAAWDAGLLPALEALWADLFQLRTWDVQVGGRAPDVVGNPFPSAYLLALLLLARLPEDGWARPGDVQEWVEQHHPFWAGAEKGSDPLVKESDPYSAPARKRTGEWASAFLLGLAQQLRFVQAAATQGGERLVRLTSIGRWLLGQGDAPPEPGGYSQTLLVQPNLEIIAYRQGLTPALVSRLARFAAWKTLGAACVLQLGPESVYRALESGLTFEDIVQTLQRHGTRATPPAVIDSLRTWAAKRDRISVYPSATLLEFASADDLNDALARGLPALRLSDRLAAVASEGQIDYRHFRLTGTRDYGLPPEKCVEVEADGVTLVVDVARSDLLLETELPRFAEPLPRPSANGRREYRLTPASLAAARGAGLGQTGLEAWFLQRTGQPLTPAARLLLGAAEAPPPALRHHLVLHVASAELADGLTQWPATRAFIRERLGPTALAVAEEDAAAFTQQLAGLGMKVETG